MEVGSIASLIAVGLIGLTVAFVLMTSSRSNRHVWHPADPVEKEKVSPIALVEEAHTWYVASKQEPDLHQSLVRTSYGIACLRAIQNSMQLDEVKGAALPPAVQGPSGLMSKLSSQQAVLLNALASATRPNRQAHHGRSSQVIGYEMDVVAKGDTATSTAPITDRSEPDVMSTPEPRIHNYHFEPTYPNTKPHKPGATY